MTADETLTVYSDFVCPFCYLGRASLRQYLDRADEPPEYEWALYDLRGYKRRPDGSLKDDVEDGKDEDYFEQVRENVSRLQEKYDVEMVGLDQVGDVDSWNAQQAALYVRDSYPDRFDPFYDAVFDALWMDGRDIGAPEVLAEIGESVGIDPDEIRDAVTDPHLEAELEKEFERAQQRGVTGIPTFVYEGHAARGAVPPEHLARLVGQ